MAPSGSKSTTSDGWIKVQSSNKSRKKTKKESYASKQQASLYNWIKPKPVNKAAKELKVSCILF